MEGAGKGVTRGRRGRGELGNNEGDASDGRVSGLLCLHIHYWTAALKGIVSCRIQGKLVRISVHLSICLPPSQPATIGLWMDGLRDRLMDRRMHRFPLSFEAAALPTSKLPLL